MELASTRVVNAPQQTVWEALNDPAVLAECLPGCESFERDDSGWRVVIAARVGPVSARFTGRMTMGDITPPTAYTLTFEGQGGAAGFVRGEARVTLAPAPNDATALTYAARAQVGGKLAQIGSRLTDGAAAKLTDDFFARFEERVGRAHAPVPAAAAQTPLAPPGGAPWIRYAAIAVIIIVLVVLYLRGGH